MGYSKRQFVEEALVEVGLGSYIFDSDPEVLATMLKRLDGLLAMYYGMGVPLPSVAPFNPDLSDINDDTDIPGWANEAIIYGLAMRGAGALGKALTVEQRITQQQAHSVMLSRAVVVGKISARQTVAGAGNNRRLNTYYNNFTAEDQPVDELKVKQR